MTTNILTGATVRDAVAGDHLMYLVGSADCGCRIFTDTATGEDVAVHGGHNATPREVSESGGTLTRGEHIPCTRGLADVLNTEQPTETPDTPAPRTGWSKAAQRRAGAGRRSHPLGDVVEAGDGYTVYEDGAFGGGRVQIWDES